MRSETANPKINECLNLRLCLLMTYGKMMMREPMMEAKQMTRSTMLAWWPSSLPDPSVPSGCGAARAERAKMAMLEKATRVQSAQLSLRERRDGGCKEECGGDGGDGNVARWLDVSALLSLRRRAACPRRGAVATDDDDDDDVKVDGIAAVTVTVAFAT